MRIVQLLPIVFVSCIRPESGGSEGEGGEGEGKALHIDAEWLHAVDGVVVMEPLLKLRGDSEHRHGP